MIRAEALMDPRNLAPQRLAETSGSRPEGQLHSYLEVDGRPADALVTPRRSPTSSNPKFRLVR